MQIVSYGPVPEKQTAGSMMLNDVTIVREEVFFQKSIYVNSAATELSGVNVMHYDRIGGPISLIHRQSAKVLQMQAEVFSEISNFVNV
ncbi:hypothetical protein ABIF38_005577 [Bradyrhizobium japonicum]|jgi:hypothetical protein|nr:hypothetical protein [Bradyrhizobium elkanii]MBP2434648.1 hypothetical protein [Bradyrhizobium elkanii]MCP1732113.1 hypothetical protein [Bradyrhizobium elkanii]MCP1968880.1 hypothetical protein [Bradyrhizobium elkanii]MCS3567447.1 hypothetical protein [Bradyrhizobium elkanii]MCS3591068.1 hypothetical protein [Bradyrhizobium elkanii]